MLLAVCHKVVHDRLASLVAAALDILSSVRTADAADDTVASQMVVGDPVDHLVTSGDELLLDLAQRSRYGRVRMHDLIIPLYSKAQLRLGLRETLGGLCTCCLEL